MYAFTLLRVTWFLTLKIEHKLRVFENTVLRKMVGSKEQEVRGRWRKLNNEELQHWCSSPDICAVKVFKSRRRKPARMR
jgi:hypothetical protein